MSDFPADEIFYVFEDSSDKIWYGTDKGLVTRNDGNTDWEQWKKSNSELNTDTVKSIIEDASGDLWIGTPK